ncbi:hypothetical protein FHT32_003603 [Variovorax sp. SG517]|uniref:CC0125/CC1285 family lipoprotein n=1 Tax=Variovorax sp. SG517 TaxID=2587117 RepID=UPI00159EB20B|nr:hypothetical protein [Variovorax sp. SG517]NVM89946.1 hypothetical protein [Variovorax sp. SG517]
MPILLLGMLAGCTTPYGPRGLAGGYVDTRIADDTYLVEFHGNGKTSGDMVWRYWIYRCAELTRQRGYSLFALASKNAAAVPPAGGALKLMSLEPDESDSPPLPSPFKGGGGGGTHTVYVPSYSGGGGTITTWHSSATIRMFRDVSEAGAAYALRADAVITLLKPYVLSQGRSDAPSREELIRRTGASPQPETAVSAQRREPVQMKDLDGLIRSPE